MYPYTHLTLNEREKILYLKASGKSITEISAKLRRNKSTISRELSRNKCTFNSDYGEYQPSKAQAKYEERRKRCKRHSLLENATLYHFVKEKIETKGWSPEEIAGRLRLEANSLEISYTSIYRAINKGVFSGGKSEHSRYSIIKYLRHKGKKRHKLGEIEQRGKIVISHDLESRPKAGNERQELGHFEADTVLGKVGKACLVTLVDRKSRYLLGGKAEKKNAKAVNNVLIKVLQGQAAKTITPDRGKEFARHGEVTAALDGVEFYFPLPHQPWQRGSNENTNGLLREYFAKGKDISNIPDEYIQEKFDELNLRPRKCLNYRTPYEVYFHTSLHLT